MDLFGKRLLLVIAALALMMPVLAACNGDDDTDDVADDVITDVVDDDDDVVTPDVDDAVVDDEDDAVVDDEDDAVVDDEDDAVVDDEDDAVADDDEMVGEGRTVEVAWIEWDEGIAVTYLWKELLEQRGFEVELTLADAGVIYTGLAQGDLDMFLDGWLPNTHAEYWDQYGDDLEEVATWFDNAVLALTVPQYVVDEHGVSSLEDLADNADLFDSTIMGIEPGAGMMGIAANDLMPMYGLDDWTLIEASTPAMLTELGAAIDAGEPIVVTLWEPHWAYAEWDLHNLEDPQGAWGEPDEIRVVTRSGFADDFPEIAEWMANFQLSSDQIGELMDYVTVQAQDGEEQEYARQWLEDGGQEVVDDWFN